MSLKYTPKWKLSELYDLENQQDHWDDVVALVNASLTKGREEHIAIVSEGRRDPVGCIVAAVINNHDGELTLVVIDDNGHTNVIRRFEDLAELYYVPDPMALWVSVPAALNERIERILEKYSIGSHSFDTMAMATRLAELGEGDN